MSHRRGPNRPSPTYESNNFDVAEKAATAAIRQFVNGPALQHVVNSAVNQTLRDLGVDIKNPEAMRADLVALRDWRETFQLIRRKGIITISLAILSLLMTAVGLGLGVVASRFGIHVGG